ncbi:MAG: DsrE family protein [Desulfofustis sp.]|nr:DsrE family protein [Desulfofustis sp.]
MGDKKHLYVLWTSDNRITADQMVFMYTVNALAYGWWEQVTLIIWGAPAKLVGEDEQVQAMVREAVAAGVHVSACKACADQLGVTELLESLDVEVTYWGKPLTEILKNDEKLLVI